MLSRIQPLRGVSRTWLVPVALLLSGPAAVAAQVRDARIPGHGSVWLEIEPSLLDWSEQFALDSPEPEVANGEREPLFAHFDGPIAARLYPGPLPFIEELNQDAAALGFDPVAAQDFSLGSLDFSDLTDQTRRLAFGFELGLLGRFAIGARAPFVLTDATPSFAFDSTGATVTAGAVAFAGSTFLDDMQGALTQLGALIAGGTLMGAELDAATALQTDAQAFLGALGARVVDGRFVPTAPSLAGMQMIQRVDGFVASFDGYGISLPPLTLPATGSAITLASIFGDPPVSGMLPARSRQGLLLGEAEVSLRVGLIDQITRRRPILPADSTAAPPARLRADSAAIAGDTASVPADTGSVSDARETGLRLRTTVGGLVRIPTGTAGFPPFGNPMDFLDVPIGDGQMDVELSLYQDVAFAGWLLVRSVATYGIQTADDLPMRVHPPDRPYAFESTETVVHRDLGDYFELTIRPGLILNSAMRIGLEYDFWRLQAASYTLDEPLPDVPDASPLELETAQTRHMVGLGFAYDLSEARSRDQLVEGATPVRAPWRFEVSLRRSLSGSGGQTPAAFRFLASFRVPVRAF